MQGRIVVVEDNALVRGILQDILQGEGFAVTCFGAAEEALAFVSATPPRALVVDHHLPGMPGDQLVRALRGSEVGALRSIPVLFVTGWPQATNEPVAPAATGFIAKPFGVREFLGALRAVLGEGVPRAESAWPAGAAGLRE